MISLQRVCDKMLARPGPPAINSATPAPAWGAEFFRWPHTRYWQAAGAEQQTKLCHAAAATLLREALGIERTAMTYCAQRILASDDAVEQQVYSLTAADEARHYAWLCRISDPATIAQPPDAFGRFLQQVVAAGSPHALSYLLQIILEGWGIEHYLRLARHAQQPAVQQVMAGIARDEGLHYAAGIAHFDAGQLSAADHSFIRQTLATLCQMLACGPLALLEVLEHAAGGLSADERAASFDALFDRPQTAQRLQRLARFVACAGMAGEAAWLEQQGLLTPMSAEAGLRIYGDAH